MGFERKPTNTATMLSGDNLRNRRGNRTQRLRRSVEAMTPHEFSLLKQAQSLDNLTVSA
jgi:ABC-type ATPase involved in cell division